MLQTALVELSVAKQLLRAVGCQVASEKVVGMQMVWVPPGSLPPSVDHSVAVLPSHHLFPCCSCMLKQLSMCVVHFPPPAGCF